MREKKEQAKGVQAIHVYVSGVVQGVNFRFYTQKEAKKLGLTGWVRNLNDGRVEAWAEGESTALEEFKKFCKRGPSLAHVTGVETEFSDSLEKHEEFHILPNT